MPEGVVAMVNGESIHVRTVQALLDSRSGAMGMWQRPTLANLKDLYGEALGTLIVQALVRQELGRLQMQVTDEELDAAVDEVRRDYGDEDFAAHLTELSLDEVQWRHLMRDMLAVQKFEKLLLVPEMEISLEEIRAYYSQQKNMLLLPEIFEVCFVSGLTRAAVEAFSGSFQAHEERDPSDVDVQCIETRKEEIPQKWSGPLEKLKDQQCAHVQKNDGLWQNLCLKSRQEARTMSLTEAFPYIEYILLEEKKNAAFEAWLTDSLNTAEIKVSPLFRETFSDGTSDGSASSEAMRSETSEK